MAYCFGDGFDLYGNNLDPVAGFWDSGVSPVGLIAGRLGGLALTMNNAPISYVKNSGQNDGVHHISCAFRQSPTLGGVTIGSYFQLSDGATNQVCIVFRGDGTILLTSATPGGTVLDTYTGAVSAGAVWFQFEFEVVIHNTVGSWAVRKNGNPSNDRATGSLNTRPGANAYANKLTMGMNSLVTTQYMDDVLWRSDATSVAWAGDIRCYTRMPVSDASVQFARSPITSTQLAVAGGSFDGVLNGTARYTQFTPTYTGTIGTITTPFQLATTCNMKCSIFASTSTPAVPGAVLGSATPVALSGAFLGTWTFPTPVSVVNGTQYWVGFDADAASGNFTCPSGNFGWASTTAYASFPVASPVVVAEQQTTSSIIITLTVNSETVDEAQQDGTTTYVYDSVPGHADFYNVAAPASTPTSVVAVTTRGFMQKSDSGTRTGTVQIKSGVTTAVRPFPTTTTQAQGAGIMQWLPFIPSATGTIASASVNVSAPATAHIKVAIYNAAGTTLLGTSSEITNPVAGDNVMTFSPPVSVTSGTSYLFAHNQDASVTFRAANASGGFWLSSAYASFPPATVSGGTTFVTPTDFSVYVGAATTVAAPTVSLTTGFLWAWRTDTTDPNIAAGFATWSTTDKSSNQTLSGGNLIATSTSASLGGVRLTTGNTTGKWYWELTFNTNVDASSLQAGVTIFANSLASIGVLSSGTVVCGAAGTLWANATFITGMSATTAGMTMCFAMDAAAGLVWVRVGAAGNWNNSGTNNPATGVGGLSPAGGGAALYPFYRSQASAESVTANFGASAFVGTAPSGFSGGFAINTAWTAANALAVQIGPTVVS